MEDIWASYKNFRTYVNKCNKDKNNYDCAIRFLADTGDEYQYRKCEICKKEIDDEEWLQHESNSLDICSSCYNLPVSKIIKEEKVNYKFRCRKCDTIITDSKNMFRIFYLEMCETCYCENQNLSLKEFVPEIGFFIEKKFNITNNTISIDILYCDASLPNEFKCSNFTPSYKYNKEYISIIESLVHYKYGYIDADDNLDYKKYFEVIPDMENKSNFMINTKKESCSESILHWAILEEASECSDAERSYSITGLLININDGEQVASYVIDDHGRASIVPIFKSFDNYKKARLIWEESRKSIVLDDKCSGDYDCTTLLYANFSAYCRLITGHDLYYG